MRVTREQAAENRERIVRAAARLFREGGFAGVGVDAVSKAARLTHGNIYSRFGSKEALMAAAVNEGHNLLAERAATVDKLEQVSAGYLSPFHRDNPGGGCFLATLASEGARQKKPVRKSFTGVVKRASGFIARLIPARKGVRQEEEALAILSTLVGSLILSRAVDDKALSDKILKAGRRHIALSQECKIPNRKA